MRVGAASSSVPSVAAPLGDRPIRLGRLAAATVSALATALVVLTILWTYTAVGLHFVGVAREGLSDPSKIDATAVWAAVERWQPDPGLYLSGEAQVAQATLPGCQAARTYGWTGEGRLPLQLVVAICADYYSAYGVAEAATVGGTPRTSTASADVGATQRQGPHLLTAADGRVLVRIWSRGNEALALRSACGSDIEACDLLNARQAQDLASVLPRPLGLEDDPASRREAAANALIKSLITLMAIALGPIYLPRYVTWRKCPRPILTTPDGARDVGASAGRKVAARTAIGVGIFLVLLAALRLSIAAFMQLRYGAGDRDLTNPIIWGGLALGTALWGGGRSAIRRTEFRYSREQGGTPKAVLGRALVSAGRRGVVVSIGLLALTLSGYWLGLAGHAFHAEIATIEAATNPPRRLVTPLLPLVFAEVATKEGLWLLLAQLVVVSIAGGVCFGLGARLAAESLHEALERDTRAPVLLLRSFDEDAARVRARVLTPGILPLGMTPRPVLPFERVLAHGLTHLGPVIGIAPPETRLPQLGAAKTTLQDSEWRNEITRLASDALAVVVLATPTSVSKEGLGWEIDLLTQHVRHNRLMVVLGPYDEAQRDARWDRFCRSARNSPPMAGLGSIDPAGSLRVAVRSANREWELFAGAEADDSTYLAAIAAATESIRGTWAAERTA